ncbi:MAG TPA: hypothetical protein VGP02_07010 [Mycobacteriales bacterium]|nr:hypothetical protein [Mycobacteriales bacterium]
MCGPRTAGNPGPAAPRTGERGAPPPSTRAPLVTDALVVAATPLVLDRLPHRAVAVPGVAGGAVVARTGVRTIREARHAALAVPETSGTASPLAALRTASIVDLLSPHPWIAWATALGR